MPPFAAAMRLGPLEAPVSVRIVFDRTYSDTATIRKGEQMSHRVNISQKRLIKV